jgi:hypothetical protein
MASMLTGRRLSDAAIGDGSPVRAVVLDEKAGVPRLT